MSPPIAVFNRPIPMFDSRGQTLARHLGCGLLACCAAAAPLGLLAQPVPVPSPILPALVSVAPKAEAAVPLPAAATIPPAAAKAAAAIAAVASAPGAAEASASSFALLASMKEMVKLALGFSPLLRQAESEWRSAVADVEQAEGQRYPQVSLQVASPNLQVGATANTGVISSKPSLGVSASLTVWDWGFLSNTINSRSQVAIAAQARYQLQAETTAFDTVSAVLQVARYRQLVAAGDAYVVQMRKFTDMLREIVQADRGRLSELTQARSRLLQAEMARDTSLAKVREFEVALRRQVGDKPPAIPPTTLDVELGLPKSLPEAILRSADHPLLRQSEAEAIAADYQSRAVRAGELPAVNWVVSKSSGVDALGRRLPLQSSLTMNYGVFKGGAGQAAERASINRAQAARDKRDQTRNDIEYRLRAADEDARTQNERADSLGQLVPETDRVRRQFFDQWYNLGRRTLLDVLTAESEYYGNVAAQINSSFDAQSSLLRLSSEAGTLNRALGTIAPDQ
ncbi:MAG: transporter [Rhizobacter sp.]|nr:transporter [Rhizobacter sp.]